MIDWQRVQILRGEIGADAFDEVVDLFLDEVETEIDKLRDPAISTGPDLEAHLHFLKGSALNLGFQTFSALCHSGETAVASGKGDTLDLSAVLDCYEQSKACFLSGPKKGQAA